MQISTLNFWKMTAALVVAGALLAGFVAFSMPDTYSSGVVFRMGKTAAVPTVGQQLVPLVTAVFSQTTLSEMILRDNLYPGVRRNRSLQDAVAQLRQDITIASVPRAGLTPKFRLAFKYTDAAQAQRTTAELMDRLRKEAQSAGRQEPGISALEILEPANLPHTAISPSRWAISAAGGAAGLLIGIVIVGMRRLSGLVSRP